MALRYNKENESPELWIGTIITFSLIFGALSQLPGWRAEYCRQSPEDKSCPTPSVIATETTIKTLTPMATPTGVPLRP